LSKLFGAESLAITDIQEYERIYRQILENAAITLGMAAPYSAAGAELDGRDENATAAKADLAEEEDDAHSVVTVESNLGVEDGSAVKATAKKRKKTEPERMVSFMVDYEMEILMFMYDFNVPFDNNLAEQSVRMPKLKVKISGCFRSEEGADIFAGIRSYVSTTIKKGKNLIDGIKAALRGQAREFLYPGSI